MEIYRINEYILKNILNKEMEMGESLYLLFIYSIIYQNTLFF